MLRDMGAGPPRAAAAAGTDDEVLNSLLSCCGSMRRNGGGGYAGHYAGYYREGVVRRWDVAGADLWHQSPPPALWVWSQDCDAHQLKHDGLQELVDWNMGRRGMHEYSCHRREVELWQKVLERTDGNWSCHTEKRANVAEWASRGNPSVNVIWPPVGAPP